VGYPNLLIIASQIPQTVHAGSLQLYRVLEDYPKDKIRSIGPIEPKAEQLSQTYDPFLLPIRLTTTRFAQLAHTLNTIRLLPDLSVSKINKLLGDFRPDLVITLVEILPYAFAALRYAKTKGLPLMTITMDKPGDFTYIYSFFKNVQFRRMQEIYKHASVNLGVSKEMAEHIKSTFNSKCDVLYFCPPEGLTARDPQKAAALRNGTNLTIGYAGSLALGYGQQLTSMIQTFEKAGLRLNIYSINQPTFSSPEITYRGSFTQYEVWERIKEECDCVILPYYFHYGTKETSVYSTHFPTKLSEYLTLGMPVIVIGPEWATGVKWAKAHADAVLTSTKEEEDKLMSILDNLTTDASFRLKYSLNPLKAKEEFSPSVIKKQFLDYIQKAEKNTLCTS
jgi:glycosyltransferase involved in cell wall biosynthesis